MDYTIARELIEFNGSGKGDITPLIENRIIFREMINDLALPFRCGLIRTIDKVAGLEARGFAFASSVAYILKAGVVLVRKCPEISRTAIKKNDRVLIVGDWLKTENQLKTAINLIEGFGGVVTGIAMVIDDATPKARKLVSGYKYHYLIKMPKNEGIRVDIVPSISVSGPHSTGIAALLLEAFPGASPLTIKTALLGVRRKEGYDYS